MSNRQKLKDLKLLRDHVSNSNNATTSSSTNDDDASMSLTPSKGKNGKKNSSSSTFALQVLLARIDAEILHLETPNKTRAASTFNTNRSNSSHATSTSTSTKGSTRTDTKHEPFSVILSTIRVIFLDIPMTLLFLFLTLSILIQQYYNHYVSPTIDAANWIHNDYERLQHEFTYYSRECDSSDITATSVQTVKLDPLKHKAQDAVDNFMIHGMTLFPSLLDSETATELRTYISRRNEELTDDEVIPLDGPANRLSFGIHANEHPSVAKALEQLSSNTLLEESLERMLGIDPAVAEITAISVAPGAEPQGWHSDVKELGNSLKYAQTFTHSYSIFIPLQDVTPEMGATELCPGTQYCADQNLHDLCVRHGFQAAGSRPEEIWKVGDGLAMDQRMWHRGSAYKGTGQHRIVFIITFISRPAFGVDQRQLSHGTYFHIHPHMYGHTFRDLKHASVSMSWPFAPLRSLGLWKPPNANWGWDWVTTSATRIANYQNGYQFGDLMDFVDHPIGLMIPHWLHGSMVDDDDSGGWQLYFKETFDNFVYLGMAIYGVVLFLALGVILSLDVAEGFQHGRIGSFVRRMLVVNGIILLLSYQAVLKVKSTTYAQSVEDGTIFANPFLQKPIGSIAEKVLNARLMGLDLTSAPKLTTIPEKRDILFGNRFDSKNIGYYSNFLNYHPGNMEWRKLLGLYSRLDKDYSGLPSVFRQQVEYVVKKHVESSGRMLTQNVFGEWTVMDEDDVRNAIDRGLVTGVDTLLAALDKAIAIVSADARHKPPLSGSRSIQVETLRNLDKWKLIIAPTRNGNDAPSKEYKKPKITNSLLRTSLSEKRSIPNTCSKSKNESKRQHKLAKSSDSEVKVGDMVLANFRGTGNYLPARVIYKEYKHYGVVKFNVGEGVYMDRDKGGERSNEYLKNVKPYTVIKEGDLVAIMSRECDRCPITFEAGTIIKCFPDMICDVRYDSGEMEEVHKDDIALRFEN